MNLFLSFLTPVLLANTWTVDAGGGGDFTTIQDAINASTAGDLIQVVGGSYEEDLLVHTPVTIEAVSGDMVTIYPATSNPGTGVGAQISTTTQVCIIEADDVTLRGLTINGNNPNLAANLDARNGVIVNYENGPWHRLTVEDCTVRNFELRAISGSTGTDHVFRGNFVRNAKAVPLESTGIMLWSASGTIENNDVVKCSLGVVNHNRSTGDIFDNDISECDVAVLTNGTQNPSAVHHNLIRDCTQGHQMIGLHADVTSHNNTFIGCTYAFNLFGSTANSLIEDNFIDGQSVFNATGIKGNTDLSPWGTNSIIGQVKRNQFMNLTSGVVLQESNASKHELVDLVIGGAAVDSNSFRNISNLNLQLLNCDDNINATFNSWGVATAAAIESTIYHQVDDPGLGLVDFSNAVADIVTVDSAGGADFLTIQEGVDAVDPGGLVSVALGDYIGSVVIHKSLTLEGSGNGEQIHNGTRVMGDEVGPNVGNDVITVIADNVEISNMWIDGWSNGIGDRLDSVVIFDNADNGFIHDVFVHQGMNGIQSLMSDGLRIENSIVEDCGIDVDYGGGIVFHQSTGTVGGVDVGNTVRDCESRGFWASQGSAATMIDNYALNCFVGFTVSQSTGTHLLQGNSSSGCDVGFMGISNDGGTDLLDNRAISRPWHTSGFSLYGGGTGLYNLTGNVSDGSGAATYGMYVSPHSVNGSSDLHAILRDNCLLNANVGLFVDERGGTGNWVDLDFSGAAGSHNIIAGHAQYAVRLKRCNDPVDMSSTYWGTTDPLVIANMIYDNADDPILGAVDASNPLLPNPDLRVDPIHRSEGYRVQLIVTGFPGDAFTIGGSQQTGTWHTRFGTLGISQHNSFEVLDARVPASGVYIARADSVPGLEGPAYLQGVVFGGVRSITNLEEIRLRPAP